MGGNGSASGPEPGGVGVSAGRGGFVVSAARLLGKPRDSALRRLAHEPWGWRPTALLVTVCRDACTGCGHV